MNDYYLLEQESASGTLALAGILTHQYLGLKIGAETVVSYLIKYPITDILETDDNYSAKNMTEKYDYKKELKEKLEQQFAANDLNHLKLEFETYSNNSLTKTNLYATKIDLIND